MKSKALDLRSKIPNDIQQVAALPVLRGSDGVLRVVLITTRDSGRWTVPKGNPIKGLKPHEAALREAGEEGGLNGTISKKSLGIYDFWKRRADHWELAKVTVYLLIVDSIFPIYKEKGMRRVEAFSFEQAEESVLEPGLKSIIRAASQAQEPIIKQIDKKETAKKKK